MDGTASLLLSASAMHETADMANNLEEPYDFVMYMTPGKEAPKAEKTRTLLKTISNLAVGKLDSHDRDKV